jgi:cysteine desulfurase
MERVIYLDHNATAPVKPAAAAAMAAALKEFGNPSSVHRFGRLARRKVEEARERIAALVGAAPAALVFTSGGSEANALALAAAGARPTLVGSTEHDSVVKAAPQARAVPVLPSGVTDLDALRLLLKDSQGPFVSIMLANNETGVLQPTPEIARLVHEAGGLLHVDAAQAIGRLAVDMAALGADLLTVSAHKMGGPQGVGALAVSDRLAPSPIVRGGGQERGWRAGTENVPGIVGFAAAAEEAAADLARVEDLRGLRDGLERRVRSLAPGARAFGAEVPRLANTSCLLMPGAASETQVVAFDLAGIAVSAGSACSSGRVRRSAVLDAMGVAPQEAECAIRVSLGWSTTAEDVDRFVECWLRLFRRLGSGQGRALASA